MFQYTQKHILHFIFILLTFLSVNSCTINRKTISTHHVLQQKKASEIFSLMKENELKFNTFKGKFSLTIIKNDKKNRLTGQIRILKDSIIWITLSPALGIEAFRIQITNDTVKFMNRLDKTYFLGGSNYVKDFVHTNIDLDVIQALFLGNDLTFYDQSSFSLDEKKENYILTSPSRRKLRKHFRSELDKNYVFNQKITLKPHTYKITKMRIKEAVKDAAKLEVEFDDFRYVETQLFPFHARFILNDGKKDYFVKVDYKNIVLDKKMQFPFHISKKYKALKLYDR